MTAADWTPLFVLPNIPIETAIGCEIAALAPASDPRIAALKRAHPSFRRFLNRFSDNFGEKFEPSVLILDAAAPPIFRDVTALASFRDLIALSAFTHGRALELRHPRGHRVLFGEAFAIYPWMLDQHFEDVIGSTPAILGTHELSRFKGQSSSALFRTSFGETDIDQPLLAALMARWRRRYQAAEPAWEDVALMRSLNMAYQASLLPAGTDTTFYDVGRVVSLWVSAFEILVRPGGSGQANRDKVFEMIERTPWAEVESSQILEQQGWVLDQADVKVQSVPFSKAARYRRPDWVTFHAFRSTSDPSDVAITDRRQNAPLPADTRWTYYATFASPLKAAVAFNIRDIRQLRQQVHSHGYKRVRIERMLRRA